jgi:hypothetical protein
MIDHLVGRPSPSWKRIQVGFLYWLTAHFLHSITPSDLGVSRHILLGLADHPGECASTSYHVAKEIQPNDS